MNPLHDMSPPKRIVLGTAALLFLIWITFNAPHLVAEQNDLIRLSLATLFSLLILVRPKPEAEPSPAVGRFDRLASSRLALSLAAVAGAIAVLAGIVLDLGQVEWIGLLLLLASALAWALPEAYRRDILLSLFLLYWAHPLPGTLFASLQFAMQKMSVAGSEGLLHLLNVRVWADGFILRTGLTDFEIPSWCSGMRTATTVFLLSLGIGFLKRFRWVEMLVLLIAALVQALLLNILRISVMVLVAPFMGSGESAGLQYLHNTAGLIVLVAVLLVYLETLAWQAHLRKRTSRTQEVNPDAMDELSGLPPFWRFLHRRRKALLAALLLAVLVGSVGFKLRPYHRAEMIKTVAEDLRDSGQLEAAERAAFLVQALAPDDGEWAFAVARLLTIRKKYEEGILAIRKLPGTDETRILEKKILTAYCLMGLNRMKEAGAIVAGLPERVRMEDARVTMILAEIAFHAGKPDEVARNVVIARRWKPNITRIRALYPYLRSRRKWDAIASSDLLIPHADSASAYSAMEAGMNLDQTPRVASLTLQALAAWPTDPRVLEPLFFMALKRKEKMDWESRFSGHLLRCLPLMDNPDAIQELFDKCFRLSRPDLGWAIYRRLAQLDRTHPALALCAARHGDRWFVFRNVFLSTPAADPDIVTDLRAFFRMGESLASLRPLSRSAPLLRELAVADTAPVRKRFLKAALTEFRERESRGTLSLTMHYEYVKALEMAGDIPSAKRVLARLTAEHPEMADRNTLLQSELFERLNDWQNVYETLRGRATTDNPDLPSLVRLCRAELELRLNLAASFTARKALRHYPNSSQATAVMALALLTDNAPDEALAFLCRPRPRREANLDIFESEALFRTQRYNESVSFTRTTFLAPASLPDGLPQSYILQPAEASLLWHYASLPTEAEFTANARILEQNLPGAVSPFLRNLMRLWLECRQSRAKGGTADSARWSACGRDRVEKAIALNQLTLLLCREGRFVEARNAAGTAVKLLPEAPVLWHILISLSAADSDVIRAARRSCPEDAEIWLADLVAATRRRTARIPEDEVLKILSTAIGNTTAPFSAEAMARAGDYLFRIGYRKAAILATRDAENRARGLLPVYLLGLRCALAQRDRYWALDSVRKTIESSLTPPPRFHRTLVELKMNDQDIQADNDLIASLKVLRSAEPGNPLWAQMFGYVRFARGGWESIDALSHMTSALDLGATNKTPFLVAAESARLLGQHARAADILQRGLRTHPGDVSMLNNLVYTLALSPGDAGSSNTAAPQAQAMELASRLMAQAGNDPHVMDTAALAFACGGNLGRAESLCTKLLRESSPGSRLWFRAKMLSADIVIRRAKAAAPLSASAASEALAILKDAFRFSKGVPDEDILTANKLLAECQDAMEKKEVSRPAPPMR